MSNNESSTSQILIFGMKNLMLEGELAKLERSGIEIGHNITLEKDELVVCYGHEPSLTVSIIELAKEFLGYDGKNNAEFFKEITGTGQHYFAEGEGYAIEVREEDGQTKVYLITDKGEIELNIDELDEGEEAESEDNE